MIDVLKFDYMPLVIPAGWCVGKNYLLNPAMDVSGFTKEEQAWVFEEYFRASLMFMAVNETSGDVNMTAHTYIGSNAQQLYDLECVILKGKRRLYEVSRTSKKLEDILEAASGFMLRYTLKGLSAFETVS